VQPLPDVPPPIVEEDAPWDEPYLGQPVPSWAHLTFEEPVGAPTRSHLDPSYDELGEAALQAAIDDLYVREVSSNWGPEIEQYLAHSGITFPAAWCAAGVSYWIKEGSEATGIERPIEPNPLAQGIRMLMRDVDRWIDTEDVTIDMIRPGMLMVWTLKLPDKPWRGHIGIVERVGEDGVIHTVEGNVLIPDEPGEQGVARRQRTLYDPKLLGFGVLSGPMPWDQPQKPPSPVEPLETGWVWLALALGAGAAAAYIVARRMWV
jgi:hypothetical protein